MKKDRFYYSANLAGLTVLLYLFLSTLLRGGLDLLLFANLAGAGLQNPMGISEALAQLLNCLCALLNLGLPIFVLHRSLREMGIRLPRSRVSFEQICTVLPVFMLFVTASTALVSLARSLLLRGGYTPPATVSLPSSSVALFLCLIATCVVPAIGEELLFRGLIQSLFRGWGDWFAILVTSLFFSLLHRDLSQVPSIFAMSVFLGYLAVRFDSLIPSMVLHLANNLSSFLLVWAKASLDQTSALGLFATLFTIYIGCGILALVVALRHRVFVPLPHRRRQKGQMSLAERLIYAPVFDFAVLLLVITAMMEYWKR